MGSADELVEAIIKDKKTSMFTDMIPATDLINRLKDTKMSDKEIYDYVNDVSLEDVSKDEMKEYIITKSCFKNKGMTHTLFQSDDYLIDNKQEGKNNEEDFLDIKYNNNGQAVSTVVNIDKVADYLINKHKFKTWFGTKNDYCHNFDGKKYNAGARGLIKTECENLLKSSCKTTIVLEIWEKIKRKTKIEKEAFETVDKNLIGLNNGVWDIKNKKLLPHDPKYYFRTLIPIDKNDDELNVHNCKKWLKFIDEVLYEEDVKVMQEFFGFFLFREYFLKKGCILVGEQDTGKSVLLDTASRFVGDINRTGLSLQKITGGTDFTKLSLKDKHANLYDDLSSKDLNDGGAFKVATGGGFISGEEKFGEFHQFRSFAKQMFATNKIPPVRDNDDLAYFGRWIVFRFDNIPEIKDPFLRDKLWTDKELSGILNWAMEGLYRLLDSGKFSYDKSSQEIKHIMESDSCPLVAFSSDVLNKSDGIQITKDEMFEIYTLWCEEMNKPRLTKKMLGTQLTKYCSYILDGRKGANRYWANAKISTFWNNKLKKSKGKLK